MARSFLPSVVALALCASVALAQDPPQGDFAVHCGELLRGDGSEPLRNAWLVVRGGKVAAIQNDAPIGLPVVDARSRVVMPGIVAVDSDLGAEREDDYSVTPDVLAIDGFDFEYPLRPALEGGVTTVYLSPGRQRLVSGQGAVVKTAGNDLVQRVLTENACLRMSFDDGATNAPRVFEPTVHPTDEDPLEAARIQTPTARIASLVELRALLKSATPAVDGMSGEGPAQRRYDDGALASAAAGKLSVRAGAWKLADIRRALTLQKEFGMPMTLENPMDIGSVADEAKAQGIAAVFRMPFWMGRANPGGEDRAQKTPEPVLDAPARAAKAGMKVGLAPAAGAPMRDYLVAVALAVRHGMPAANALRAIGADASAILGVDDRVGTLAPGKDADFVVLSGDPLAIGTMVESTWVDGRRAFARADMGQLVAVRCKTILDGSGRTIDNGVLLAQNGRIKAVGSGLAIPFGAQVIDVPTAVMTPGFIDSWSSLGLAGEGQGVPQGASNQRLDQAIAFDDPMFAPALQAGVTTVLTSGKDSGLLSGRVAAVKTGAASQDALVVRAIAGQRAVFDAVGPDSDKPLKDAIARARAYAKTWADYEKAFAEYKAGKKPAAEKAPEPQKPAEAADKPDPISGTWEANLDLQGRFQIKVLLDLKLEGTKVSGKIRLAMGQRELPEQGIESGSFEGDKLKLEFRGMGGNATLEATVKDESFDGSLALGPMGSQPISGKRISKESGASSSKALSLAADDEPSDAPKKPDVDHSQEPMRAVVEGRASLVVKVSRLASIKTVLAVLEQEKVPFVLQDPQGMFDDPTTAASKPFVLLEPEVVREDGAQIVNAASRMCDLDVPVVFGTGDCAGSRYLPLHAAYAVRYGMAPDQALMAITSHAARAFKLDDRIGTLQRGKDADFVVFSGDPFEPQSRVLLVACNGQIVVDNREAQK